MKSLSLIAFFCLLSVFAIGQTVNPAYDPALAKALGGDNYGMKPYVLVILKTGPNNMADKAAREKLFEGHMRNIGRLADEGKLVVAGPLAHNKQTYRGIFILDVATPEEARELLQTDPVIKEKLLEAELFSWYGSAALPEYLKAHKKIEKFKIVE